jgi:hypothetical protein
MKIEALNEDGSIRPASGDSCFEFSYGNPFSGSCRFTARVNTGEEKGLFVDPDSIRWLEFRPKSGRDQLLSTHALTFFRHFLSRKDSLEQFESRVRPTFLYSLWRKWIQNRGKAGSACDLQPEERRSALAREDANGLERIASEHAKTSSGARGSWAVEKSFAESRGEQASESQDLVHLSGGTNSLAKDPDDNEPPLNGAKRTHPAGTPPENLTLPFPEYSPRKQD